MIWEQLDILEDQTQEYQKHVDLQQKKAQSENKYYNSIFKQIDSKVVESESILQRFTFSQEMIELLISDLLDLAKFENNQFSLTNDLFNL